jgi:GNAT superfamily N-acetyltransferase
MAIERTTVPPPEQAERVSRLGVRRLRHADLAWTEPLQRSALPHGFFTRLGPTFLRAYQRTFLESPVGIALAAEEDGAPAGFLLGAVDAETHREWVLHNRRGTMFLLGAACLLAHPREAVRFCQTRVGLYLRALAASARPAEGDLAQPPPAASAELTHVAVSRKRRRSGAGRRLVQDFVAEARRRGAVRARLTTLHDDAGAEGFWRALGWSPGAVAPDGEGRLYRVFEREV